MNKKVMSVSAVAITVITVYVMIYSSKYCNNSEQLSYSNFKNDKPINNNSSNRQDKNIDPNGTTDSENIVKNNADNKVKNNTDDSDKKNNINSTEQDGNSTVKNQENGTDDIENNGVHSENTMPIFKISKSQILDKLSFTDKAKLVLISKSLSPTDFSKLQDDVNSEDQKKGIASAMNLLKRRLDDQDYNKLKSIASKFINLEALN